ncbi:light-harvesting complex-like protein OHP2, chloroplastic [Andrographis paniculata]|uniref:light-harvesting complex-like protein OHP2, chloroplastic n=1 Tax=Andrographis paniculata TaxID=175694 RepID=UPI0021E7F8D9|nr:light-harvesting complex-like protein OHP2, chloroplastic [Andrographis paniculata]
MSVAPSPSFPRIRFPNPSTPSPPSYASYAPSSSSIFKFTVRNSQTEGPFRRPVAPTPVKPVPPTPPPDPSLKPTPAPAPAPVVPAAAVEDKNVVTLEFQRQKAKELQEYFKQKKIEEAAQGPFFGFVGKNEIANGRWAMFGFAVGMLTEYATGSDFVDQVKILLSNFGVLDLD